MRGTALGTYQLGLGFAVLASSSIAGWLWDSVGPASPFAFGSVGALVALGCLFAAARVRAV
jgi:predicted MFS family arabinose efflux permease